MYNVLFHQVKRFVIRSTLVNQPVDGKTPNGPGSVSVVERAFFVLQAVAAEPDAVGVRQLARLTDLAPATVLRLVRTLTGLGMVTRRPDGLITIGPGVETLTRSGPVAPTAERLMPLVSRVVERFNEGATAAIDDGDGTLFLAHLAPSSAVQITDVTGDRWPAHTTASGIVLMGAWPPERLDAYLDTDLGWPAPNTISDPGRLRDRVEQVRAAGYAWSIEELVADAAGLAAAVRDRAGTIVAAVGLYAPTYRLHPDLDGLDGLPRRLTELVDRLSPAILGQ